jgi:hypothetical protein
LYFRHAYAGTKARLLSRKAFGVAVPDVPILAGNFGSIWGSRQTLPRCRRNQQSAVAIKQKADFPLQGKATISSLVPTLET